MLDIQTFKKRKIAINCQTVEEAIMFRDWLHEHNINWCSGNDLYKYENLKWANRYTCYRYDGSGLVRGEVSDYSEPFPVIPNITIMLHNEAFSINIDTSELMSVLGG